MNTGRQIGSIHMMSHHRKYCFLENLTSGPGRVRLHHGKLKLCDRIVMGLYYISLHGSPVLLVGPLESRDAQPRP